jgi:hypothetical protein
MNIFYLHPDAKTCAEMHVDRHVVKMIIEYAQLMSTAHRVLDGTQDVEKRYVAGSIPARWRHIKIWNHPIPFYDKGLMRASHVNHPSAVWTRANKENYVWLNQLWNYLLQEYTYRYGKIHSCEKYKELLYVWPNKIVDGTFYPPTPAMPDDCKIGDTLLSYRKYYIDYKNGFAKWKNRQTPDWYVRT